MAITTVAPPDVTWTSITPKIFCLSDIHLGNTRPTNDCTPARKRKLTRVLMKIGSELVHGDLQSFDLVLNGDIFDFWKAIPNPMPSTAKPPIMDAFNLHSLEDYKKRFAEILESNQDIVSILTGLLYDTPDPNTGSNLYILTGNHDDPADDSMFGAGVFRQMLVDNMQALAPAGFHQEIDDRVKWGRPPIYTNRTLKVHIQHGHRWDEANLLRRDNGDIIWSEGQVLVENFLNGLHDNNINTMEFAWERLIQLHPNIVKPLQLMDNFTEHTAGMDYVNAMIPSQSRSELEALMEKHFLMTLWQANHRSAAFVATLPIPGLVGVLQALYEIVNRDHARDMLRSAAATVIGLGQSKIVLFGHSHIFDHIPPLNNQTEDNQYVNTGTFVDVYKFDASLGDRRRVDMLHPVKVHKPSVNAKVHAWEGNDWSQRLVNDVRI